MVLDELDATQIKEWRSIVTLIVFVGANIVVLFPFHVRIYVPRKLHNAAWDVLSSCRIIHPRPGRSPGRKRSQVLQHRRSQHDSPLGSYINGHHLCAHSGQNGSARSWKRLYFPMNFVTAPLIADLFLLATLAIGREEILDGTLGVNNIHPIDIMAFFLTLAYIAISIDASGMIRYLACKVLQKGGKYGHRLYFYLYVFFFGLASLIGNDPIVLSGTPFLAYMTTMSNNIKHPRAWIHTQFAVANIGSAILVSSNPTNLVLAGAFDIKFIVYTANMIVPVIVTVLILFPALLHIIFSSEALIPSRIELHELSDEAKNKTPVNPNIPLAKGVVNGEEDEIDHDGKELSLEEIMNPFIDKWGAGFGIIVISTALITILVVNASSQNGASLPVYWITLPAAFVMFCWDLGSGWYHRAESRRIARDRRERVEGARARLESAHEMDRFVAEAHEIMSAAPPHTKSNTDSSLMGPQPRDQTCYDRDKCAELSTPIQQPNCEPKDTSTVLNSNSSLNGGKTIPVSNRRDTTTEATSPPKELLGVRSSREIDERRSGKARKSPNDQEEGSPTTLLSLCADSYQWCQETFPTATAVLGKLPYALVPFALCMFVLVQGLVTKGWVPVFAYGWGHWVYKTGTVGAIGGMAFISVVMCNFAGTNIGTSILLCRVVQTWVKIHHENSDPITQRTFWATIYSMALGLNYGAFSTAFSASLAGMLWRDILRRKFIYVSRVDFARVNLPIITSAMAVGCAVLIGEVYITRGMKPYEG